MRIVFLREQPDIVAEHQEALEKSVPEDERTYISEQFQREGGECKSAASWLRRFESYLPHQPSP
jgi:hypothetical protein